MIKHDLHKRALERLEGLVDLDHVAACEAVQEAIGAGKPVASLPCRIGMRTPAEWPTYSFAECWDDLEKNFVSALADCYCGALLRDDGLCTVRPEYGVVNIPALFGIPSQVSDEGRSMSEGLNDTGRLRDLLAAGMPDLARGHSEKVAAWYEFAEEALGQYEKLSRAVHFVVPDPQGPFDLACLVYGSDILAGVYDEPELIRELLELMTETFVAYHHWAKGITGEPLNRAYHIAGLKLARGGVRICDDSATLVSPAAYREFVQPYNLRCFAPFDGGWLHFCGDGNHILDQMLAMTPVHYLHLGNPDDHDLIGLVERTREREIVLFWSGALERIQEAWEMLGRSRLLVLTENRYASATVAGARENLKRVHAGQPIVKAEF